jgi:hypothetical protein
MSDDTVARLRDALERMCEAFDRLLLDHRPPGEAEYAARLCAFRVLLGSPWPGTQTATVCDPFFAEQLRPQISPDPPFAAQQCNIGLGGRPDGQDARNPALNASVRDDDIAQAPQSTRNMPNHQHNQAWNPAVDRPGQLAPHAPFEAMVTRLDNEAVEREQAARAGSNWYPET